MSNFESELDRVLRLLEGGIVGKGNDKTGYPVYYPKPYPIWVNEQKAAAKQAILDWHNKQIEATTKRLNDLWTTIMIDEGGSEKAFAYREAIEAQLKEVK